MSKNGAKSRILHPEEAKLWHRIAKSTRPMTGKSLEDIEKQFVENLDKDEQAPPKVHVSRQYARFIKSHPPTNSTHYEIADAKGHKRVRRGKLEIDATLDLHGLNQENAKTRLLNFVQIGIENHYRTLLIITGKGNINNEEADFNLLISPRGILRRRLREWLNEGPTRDLIAGISEAHLKHGGNGAFYVLLKSKKS